MAEATGPHSDRLWSFYLCWMNANDATGWAMIKCRRCVRKNYLQKGSTNANSSSSQLLITIHRWQRAKRIENKNWQEDVKKEAQAMWQVLVRSGLTERQSVNDDDSNHRKGSILFSRSWSATECGQNKAVVLASPPSCNGSWKEGESNKIGLSHRVSWKTH